MIDLATGALVIVDKPAGMTSHDVVQRLRRLTGIRRVGHAGTLDPLATGVLPVLIGPATRLLRFVASDPKVYRTSARFGYETTTGDTDGEPLGPTIAAGFSDAEAAAACTAMLGRIDQLPPMYSAKKVGGRRLYQAARAGIEVERQLISVRIDRLEVLGRDGEMLELEIECSPGTYVRSLVVDLGRALGSAATVARLRRLRSGHCQIGDAVALDRLESAADVAAVAQPIDALVLELPDLALTSAGEVDFVAGRPTLCAGDVPDGEVAVRAAGGRLLGVGVATRSPDLATMLIQPRVVLLRADAR